MLHIKKGYHANYLPVDFCQKFISSVLYPSIYDIETSGGVFSMLIIFDKVLSVQSEKDFSFEEKEKLFVRKDTFKYPYYTLLKLADAKIAEEYAPYLSDYDLIKLVENGCYSLLKAILPKVPAREIYPSLMSRQHILNLFTQNEWVLSLNRIYEYYESPYWSLYYPCVLHLLSSYNYEREEKYFPFLKLASEREDEKVLELLDVIF